jgi:L-histidine N-alpha-methyltransferase
MITRLEVVDAGPETDPVRAFARDVQVGLSRSPKRIPSCYFYDERGSRLFQQITQLDEYYLTACEREILLRHAADIADAVGSEHFRLVEAGAGDGHKTEILLREFVKRNLSLDYSPIDICRPALVQLLDKLRRRFPPGSFRAHALAGDYFAALRALHRQSRTRNLVLFLGSSIGNFDHSQAARFLGRLRRTLRPGDLALIGFDLKKDVALLQSAYDDSLGVTREFNLNLLDRMNRELGANFRRSAWEHEARYDATEGCMQSHLVSRKSQTIEVRSLGQSFRFAAGERVHVEDSYKYDLSRIEQFSEECGFRVRRHFFDRSGFFVDSLWEAIETR